MDLFDQQTSLFPTSYDQIIERVNKVDPIKYRSSRNYINGAVTYLSPYISRGVLSTKFVLTETLKRGFVPVQIEKFIQELAWRDYWQQVWIAKGNKINQDLKHQQNPVANTSFPNAVLNGATQIKAIDKAIQDFYKTGYIHNHIRMYIASMVCNIGQSHWKLPAQWMYYHLLDADWASNALSWQWVAGSNANKKYIANQENINRYCFTEQENTFLDVSYEDLSTMQIPDVLSDTSILALKTTLPKKETITIDNNRPSYIYNFYNLDPVWHKEATGNRVLLLEPSHFKQYPVSSNTIDFIINLAQKNITDIKIYVGEFNDLVKEYQLGEIRFKEHPLNLHYKGIEEPREWMFEVKGYYSSFFSFWKKCKKQLNN